MTAAQLHLFAHLIVRQYPPIRDKVEEVVFSADEVVYWAERGDPVDEQHALSDACADIAITLVQHVQSTIP